MNLLGLILVAVSPSVLAFGYIYLKEKQRYDEAGKLLKMFLLGFVITIPAMGLGFLLSTIQSFFELANLPAHLFKAFLVVSFSEELFKLLIVVFFVYKWISPKSLLDGIFYTITVSLGFAGMENVFYALAGGYSVAVFRIFTALPLHIISAGIMGYYFGKAKQATGKTEETKLIYKGFGYAILIHGVYDFLLFAGPDVRMMASFGVFALLVFVFVILMNKIRLATVKDLKLKKATLPLK
ncbi:hypothetical protein B6I21_01115 [candidate division KSB1 bacterium 4572_119]|nr:MAG: hypothetical protein B6I21_01115 [candidate division KSB1 bacterium 4572_119]